MFDWLHNHCLRLALRGAKDNAAERGDEPLCATRPEDRLRHHTKWTREQIQQQFRQRQYIRYRTGVAQPKDVQVLIVRQDHRQGQGIWRQQGTKGKQQNQTQGHSIVISKSNFFSGRGDHQRTEAILDQATDQSGRRGQDTNQEDPVR